VKIPPPGARPAPQGPAVNSKIAGTSGIGLPVSITLCTPPRCDAG